MPRRNYPKKRRRRTPPLDTPTERPQSVNAVDWDRVVWQKVQQGILPREAWEPFGRTR